MKYTSALAVFTASVVGSTAFAEIDASKLPPAAAKKGLTYATDIKPLLDASCVRCHGGERPKAGLRLDSRENILKGSKEGPVVVAGGRGAKAARVCGVRLPPPTPPPP